jgi:hypothetical protein
MREIMLFWETRPLGCGYELVLLAVSAKVEGLH